MSISLIINGKPFAVNLANLPADITLNSFLRQHAALPGTKFMCLEGGCGACVCVIKGRHPATNEIRTWAANSCLTLLNVCDGWEITTIEGLGNKKDGYHPLQKRLTELNGTQCGYCSPGFIMNMYSLLEAKDGKLTMEEIENSFGGNICRCTGYRPILDTMKSFATDSNIKVDNLCKDIEDLGARCPKTGQQCSGTCKRPKMLEVTYENGAQWFWPKTVDDVFQAFDAIGAKSYMLVAGNTAHGVYRRSPDIEAFIDVNEIGELHTHQIGDTLQLGGNLSLTEAMDIFLEAAKKPGFEYCKKLYDHFDVIANVPVRNSGTLAGNLSIKHAHKEFPSDIYITFESLDAKVTIMSDKSTKKTVPLAEYLAMDMSKKLVHSFVLNAYPTSEYLFNSYKIMPRAQNAHAYVNAGFLVRVDKAKKVQSARICFGGIREGFTHAVGVEKFLEGKDLFDKDSIKGVFNQLQKEIDPDWVLPDASPEYRKTLACGLLYKFILHFAPDDQVKSTFKSGGSLLSRPLSCGTQRFDTIKKNYPLTQPVPKLEALVQCSGEAAYMNDLPTQPNEVWCAFVHATQVNSDIEEIDASEALKHPGVVAFYSAKDIPGKNSFVDADSGLGFEDEEEIFCSKRVKYFHQPLGMIVADSSATANLAAQKVKVMYSKPVGRALPTMKDVFEAKELHRVHSVVASPLKEYAPAKSGKTVAGYFDIGSQYHFTMEPQTTVCIPEEDGIMVYSATQWMDLTQIAIAKALKMRQSAIHVQVRRLGGGYGSKISRGNHAACACALACKLLNRPARFVQTIESMMGTLGKRYALHSDYEAQVDNKGKILSLRNTFYEDAGCSLNENPVGFHSVGTARNAYVKNDKWKIDGNAVITDAPSHTWCRAPGTVEGIAMMENIIEHIARETNLDPVEVRLNNIADDSKMKTLLPQFLESVEYRKREKAIAEYNEKNRWKKKGLGLAIMEYPVFYFGQYPATVSVYHADGTVAISHGGIEMGQGMNTKVAQVAAYTLGIPLDMVKVEPSDSFIGANSMVTGGAVGSESLAFAVRKACKVLLKRLEPIKEKTKETKWEKIVQAAYDAKVNLIVNDDYKEGDMEPYIVWGLCCTEVEIDVLTGNLILSRVDILEDTGESLSPNVDIGQIEGAFIMGMGYWLTEQLTFDRQSGELLTNRTWNYKVPGAKDIPVDFRIELLQKSSNTGGLLRSKATGEPAVCLSIGVVFAVRHAIEAARKDAGMKPEWIHCGAPTTVEDVLLNCAVSPETFSIA